MPTSKLNCYTSFGMLLHTAEVELLKTVPLICTLWAKQITLINNLLGHF